MTQTAPNEVDLKSFPMPHTEQPGTGQTGFEIIATFMFACVYLAPIAGVIHAHFGGTASARRSAAISPALYHIASTYGVLAVFGEHLNPYVAPVPAAAGMHAFYALLFVLLYIFARDDVNQQQAKHH